MGDLFYLVIKLLVQLNVHKGPHLTNKLLKEVFKDPKITL